MKRTITIFVFAMLLQTFNTYAQRNPHREILVFFKEGVNQENNIIKDHSLKTANITSITLKTALSKKGIEQSMLRVALPEFKPKDTIQVLKNGRVITRLNMSKLYRLKVPPGKSREALIKELNKLPEVLYAEPNGTVSPLLIPGDTRFNDQWGLQNTINPGADIHAVDAWDIYTGDPNNIIAIIDGGTDANHNDLNNKISGGDTGWGWNGHGIHVSGIAAAESDNAQGISGVDWNAQIHSQRIDNVPDDIDTYEAIIDAVDFSDNVQVLNHSWGLTDEYGNPGRYSTTVREAFAYAYKANRVSVVAMGNHQQSNPGADGYPAGFDNVIAVGATDIQDNIAGFSAQGNHIDVAAPGVNILSTDIGNTYQTRSGTSMATPHVSGIASLLKGFEPNLDNDDIENIIRLSADDRGAAGFDNVFGAGRVNAEQALQLLQPPFTLNQWSTSGGTVNSSTGNYTTLFLGAQGLTPGNYIVKRHEVRKQITFPETFCTIEGAWGRGVFTNGWSQANPNYGEGFCDIVPGTLTNTGATLRTYVYEVKTILGQELGWYPTTPGNVSFAYSVLGIPEFTGDISGPSVICESAVYTIDNLPAGASVVWSLAQGAGTVLELLQDTPGTNQLTINNRHWYTVHTTLIATITNAGCGGTITLTEAIENNNDSSPIYSYNQEACTFYNVSHPSQSGTVSDGPPTFVYQGCTVHVNIGFYKTVDFLETGTAPVTKPIYWNYSAPTLSFQLPLGSGGIPFTFDITGCYEQSLLFFTYSNNSLFSLSPNPTKDVLTIKVKEGHDQEAKKGKMDDIQFTANIYGIKTSKLLLTESNKKGSNSLKINVSKLHQGLYVLKIIEGDNIQTMKFLKE